MTSSGKIRIYELSRDLNLENKDVLNAAKKLSIPAKSHSSSISNAEANEIKAFLNKQSNQSINNKTKQNSSKEILSLKKAGSKPIKDEITKKKANLPPKASAESQSSKPRIETSKAPVAPIKPIKEPVQKANTSNQSKGVINNLIQPQKPSPLQPKQPKSIHLENNASKQNIEDNNNFQERSPRTQLVQKPPLPTKNNEPPQQKTSIPKRPITPPARPSKPILDNRSSVKSRPIIEAPRKKTGPDRNSPVQPRTQNNQNRQRIPNKPGKPPLRGNPPVELVGAPIRRSNKPNNNVKGPRDGGYRPGPPNRNDPSNQQGHVKRDIKAPIRQRPGMPPGMRKPVAPGELMQLQKPTGRSQPPAPRRVGAPAPPSQRADSTKDRQGKSPGAKQPVNRPTPATAPKKPSHRPPGSGPTKRRSDWDDAAKLEALRNKAPQKQRQKVHIIGENDDALTTETSGFAAEQEAMVLSASLARPAKPKSTKKSNSKATVVTRKRKKESTRQRQRRRAMELRAAREAKQVRPEMIIIPEGNLTVQELADKLSVESSEIIKSLFFKGITATVTQSLDLSTIETVAEEFGVPVLQDDIEEAATKTAEMLDEADKDHLIRRPPVVTVMGHVDHGKTSLLDAIRKARVASGEAGGITQHIGAYQVELEHEKKKRKLTFLDTPGHEAFTAMRARGTKVTDVAVLVVAADDGVRPQTLEAISHARAAKVPIVVAINKIDKEGASPDRVKQELSEQELVAEEWGGEVVMVPVSAIKGENIDKLLEMVLLVTEVEDLQANPDRLAKGTVIEAHLDKAKGPVATLLIQNGTLKSGDVLAAGPVLGKVRAMVDENGIRLKEAGPSCPVEALGFNEVPTAGDEFEVYPDEKSARAVVGDRASDARATRLAQQMASRRVSLSSMSGQANEGDLKELNIILKADVQGSIEAILGSLEQLPKDEVQVRVLLSAPGEVTETDVDLAAASGAVIVGFNTSMASGAKKAADANSVDVRDYEVIYKLLEDIQLAMEGLLEPDMVEESLGEAEVRAIFSIGKSAVAGCYITNGKLQRNCKVRVKRGSQIVFEGDLDSLRRNKDVVKDVGSGFECGVGCDRFANWKEGDIIQGYKLVTKRRTLGP
ncbi:translation initiation factor IF-2 [Prochlorococcus marinus]|uniref:Translation initiation factor IF-2 n=1 Tax=Prochlorococcus marinus (strain MIT 9211) TaxID=93059 RepID=IF2_PROM4|nr:translation initiation factor IF-2 [Prochlorococcus marinus]A9BCI5.1 RecName: Full=Translation initiation factor IF-2 [Prochlorococcus marinus str. MIT 9211]ABX09547.1 Translation initiation factor IF-2 [Prochlorococcus marinus str. MIT 9211]